MNIGQLKHRISLQMLVQTKDNDGFKSSSWNEIRKTWAAVSQFKQSKKIENEKETSENLLIFTFRYQEIDEKTRFVFQNKTYEIVSIEDKTFEKRFLSISAKEVR